MILTWDDANTYITSLSTLLNDWDGEGASVVPLELIRSARHLIDALQDKKSVPQAIYPLHDGNIIFEWHHKHDVIERIEVEEYGKGTRMITFPNSPAKFFDYSWQENITIKGE